MAFKKGTRENKHHASFEDYWSTGFTGQGFQSLNEPVPLFNKRQGDKIYEGEINNNAKIIIGRDRDPFGKGALKRKEQESIDKDAITEVSGYSDFMGAGAIDIVVGAGAPYPVDMSQLGLPSNLPPLYTTVNYPKVKSFKLGDSNEDHPGVLMDAARIYITQMGDVDNYFDLHKIPGLKVDKFPHSAIVLKADRVRMQSRRDIKIIAGAKNEPSGGMDSNGYTIREEPRIHLIAGNGQLGEQQPLVLGNNLIECLRAMFDLMQDNLELINSLAISQTIVNTTVSNSIRVSPAGPTAPDPLSQIANVFKSMNDMKDLFSVYYTKFFNIPFGNENSFLDKSGEKYILSRYNTTN